MPSKQKFEFPNAEGEQLAALLELPDSGTTVRAYVLFAHCFTCGKDVVAASRVARALTERGFGVVRFDFTGLGSSQGDFANTNFSSNVGDLLHAAAHMRETLAAPALLVGHSLGGAAVLAAAGELEEVRGVVTIGAPSEPAHVTHLFASSADTIAERGEAEVSLAGRKFTIKQQFVEDLSRQALAERVGAMRKALLVMHAPGDTYVAIDEARRIYEAAKHPKSFVSLDDADHLLTRRADATYVAETIAAWASRYIDPIDEPASAGGDGRAVADGEVRVTEVAGGLRQDVRTASHALAADEPVSVGGTNAGPSPYELLLAALGACTSMTLRLYARRKQLKLESVSVTLKHERIHARDCEECETREGRIDHIERRVAVSGNLSDAERERLLEIADMCPVHRTLEREVHITTRAD